MLRCLTYIACTLFSANLVLAQDGVDVVVDYKYLGEDPLNKDDKYCLRPMPFFNECKEALDIKGIHLGEKPCINIETSIVVDNLEQGFRKTVEFQFTDASTKKKRAVAKAVILSQHKTITDATVIAACRAVFHEFPSEDDEISRRTATDLDREGSILDRLLPTAPNGVEPAQLNLYGQIEATFNGAGATVGYMLPSRFAVEASASQLSDSLNMDAEKITTGSVRLKYFTNFRLYLTGGGFYRSVTYVENSNLGKAGHGNLPNDSVSSGDKKAVLGRIDSVGIEGSVGVNLIGGWQQRGLILSVDGVAVQAPRKTIKDEIVVTNSTDETRDKVAQKIGSTPVVYVLRAAIGWSF